MIGEWRDLVFDFGFIQEIRTHQPLDKNLLKPRFRRKSKSPGHHPGLETVLNAVRQTLLMIIPPKTLSSYFSVSRVTRGGQGSRTLVADEATRQFGELRPVPTGNTLLNAVSAKRKL